MFSITGKLFHFDKPGTSRDTSDQQAVPGPSKDPFISGPQPGPSTRRSDEQSEGLHGLSLSQIDIDILKELPEDIAQEVLAGLTVRNHSQHKPANHDGAENGENIEVQGDDGSAHHDQRENSSALPSLSQLNMSCFEALPACLQEEIRAEYAWQEKKAAEKDHQNTEENYFTHLTSPKKDQRNRGQTAVRGGRGRGRRGRPPGKKKHSFTGTRLKGSCKQTSAGALSHDAGVIVCDADDESTNDGLEVPGPENNDNSPGDKHSQALAQDPQRGSVQKTVAHVPKMRVESASLCGAVRLEDVRSLVKEWLSSGSEPQTEDLDLVNNYLTALIDQRNLDLAFALLKLIHRHSLRCEHHEWRIGLQNMLNSIQGFVYSNYGACLKL